MILLTGIGNEGVQLAFHLEDRSGSIKEVADIIREFGGRMVSILTSYDNVPDGYSKVYIRICNIERSKLQKLKEKLREKAALLYMVDHREDNREIYSSQVN
jgi:acetoin utilization protein AcuB